jgi:hypothetical protein
MTKKEYVEQNIGLTFDFIRHAIEHPNILDEVKDRSELYFIDKNFPLQAASPKKKTAHYKVEHIFKPIEA